MEDSIVELSEAQLRAVESMLDALVRRDQEALGALGVFDRTATPFLWLDTYYETRGVDLVRPPGSPDTWSGYVLKSKDRPGWAAVDLAIHDRLEGPTDLMLQLEVIIGEDGSARATFQDLRVM